MKRGHVLVIDDDEMSGRILSELLLEAGFQVTVMSTPIGATRRALRERVELLVLDLDMPAMTGDKLVGLFRAHERLRDLPIVLVSAAPPERLTAVARRLPGVAVVTKNRVRIDLVPTVLRAALREVGSATR